MRKRIIESMGLDFGGVLVQPLAQGRNKNIWAHTIFPKLRHKGDKQRFQAFEKKKESGRPSYSTDKVTCKVNLDNIGNQCFQEVLDDIS